MLTLMYITSTTTKQLQNLLFYTELAHISVKVHMEHGEGNVETRRKQDVLDNEGVICGVKLKSKLLKHVSIHVVEAHSDTQPKSMSKTTRTSSRRVKRCILFFIFATTVLYLYIAVYTTYRSLTNNASTTTYPTLTTNSNQTHTLTYCIPSHPRLVDSKTHYLACDGKECHQADTLSATLSSLIEKLRYTVPPLLLCHE